MTNTVTEIWRHSIKAHGRETLEQVTLTAGQALPGDRLWAVAHEEAKDADGSEWAPCRNFTRAAGSPQLMAIASQLNDKTGELTLTHPTAGQITFLPDGNASAFLEWVRPLVAENRPAPAQLVRAKSRAMTDTPYASITLANLASHKAVETAMGQDLARTRWRSNIWFDLGEAWAEEAWIDREVQIGEAVLQVRERVKRCMATTANPDTGERDAETLKTLNESFGHQHFSVAAEVVRPGRINLGDPVKVL
ncbi:MOSC domain-containing protein [Epibacterium sp. SM1979]|uniref:MOSC domain-containing protein n=1 Tax=Tritonibacter litoralis TaxID=2662264 RepID=A0A843YBW0_9RHOB|nr:MOSC N-terminal beta barrel domain-containing protein [Tritonibacter litoralis]MQQ08451.1 MOSC domain-containing protein [Tritonibacter litoralis]